MDINFCNVHYSTKSFDDTVLGCAGLELYGTFQGKTTLIGKITFWDAVGQFFLELAGPEIPLNIIEEFIRDAKQAVGTE